MQKLNSKTFGQGPPLIFIAGFGASYKIYQKNLKALKNKFQIFLLDFTKPFKKQKINLDDFTQLLHEFINQNKIKNPILAGHSFGAAVCLAYSQTYNNFKKVLALNPVGFLPLTNKKITNSTLNKIKYSTPGIKIIIGFITLLLSHPLWFIKKLKLVKKINLDPKLFSSSKKSTVVFSDKDALFPLKDLNQLSKTINLTIINGSHDWPIFKPEELQKIILKTC